MILVNVRWNDGYLETFEAVDVRFGSDLLYLELENEHTSNRHIPTRQVRWWSIDPKSSEIKRLKRSPSIEIDEG